MSISIVNSKIFESDQLCMHCSCHLTAIQVGAILNEKKEHELFLYSCPECPNITFEYCDQRDLAVLNAYLKNHVMSIE